MYIRSLTYGIIMLVLMNIHLSMQLYMPYGMICRQSLKLLAKKKVVILFVALKIIDHHESIATKGADYIYPGLVTVTMMAVLLYYAGNIKQTGSITNPNKRQSRKFFYNLPRLPLFSTANNPAV